MSDPVLALVCSNGDRIDILSRESGLDLDGDWRPALPQFKGGGNYSNSQIAEGQTLVAGQYDNTIETIPIVARGTDPEKALLTLSRVWQMLKRASDYWTTQHEYSDVYLEVRPPGCTSDMLGYARVSKGTIADYSNPFGQPFLSLTGDSVMDGISLVIEREPFWRLVPPGTIVGPLYNLLKNPDFEQWNFGVADSQPDCWDDLELVGITGTNARDQDGPRWGRSCLKIAVTGSAGGPGSAKGVTQVIEGIEDGAEYTLVGWVRNSGVISGVGRILITSLLGQYEAYRSATQHGWTLVTYKFTAGVGDVIGINCEVLSTAVAPQTLGAVYFDSLMVLKGDWEAEALAGTLPYMTSSHIYNHADTGAGHLNYVDCWEVPGDVDALVRLEVVNDTTPADYTAVVEKYGLLRIGQRRTGDVQDFQNYHDPPAANSATASNSDRMVLTPSPDWTDITTFQITGDLTTKNNLGRYRVLARVADNRPVSPNLLLRLKYWLGVSGVGVKYLEAAPLGIQGNWCMVNVTPAKSMIWDAKFRADAPGALGCTLQYSRPGSTYTMSFDYLMLLPTDGGYLEAEVNPPLEKGVALTVDNTASQSVAAEGIRAGYSLRQELSDYLPTAFCSFKGELYAAFASDFMGGPTGGIWRRRGGTWSKVYSTTGGVEGLEVFNGQLYALHTTFTLTSQLLVSDDGTSWGLATTIAALTSSYAMKSYGGKLWLGCEGAHGFIYTWDGSALALDYTIPDSGGLPQPPYSMEIYQDRLYFGTGTTAPANVYEYIPGPGWHLLHSVGETYANSLRAWNGRLYVGTSGNGRIFAYDGSTWTLVHDDSALGFGSAIQAMVVRDNMLIVASNVTGAALSKLKYTTDGATWATFYDAGSLDSMWALISYGGSLLMGALNIASAAVYEFVAAAAFEYSIPNYSGGPFTAPNRQVNGDTRRHRWVFSVDRANGSNIISDRGLIGLAFVPRYAIIPSKR